MNRCQCLTQKGTQCSRAAINNGSYCSQHKTCGNKTQNVVSRPVSKPLPRPVSKPLPRPVSKPLPRPVSKPLPIKPKKIPVSKPIIRKALHIPKKKEKSALSSQLGFASGLQHLPPELAKHILSSTSIESLLEVCKSLPPNVARNVCDSDLFGRKLKELIPEPLFKKYRKFDYYDLLLQAEYINKFVDNLFMVHEKKNKFFLSISAFKSFELLNETLPNLDKYILHENNAYTSDEDSNQLIVALTKKVSINSKIITMYIDKLLVNKNNSKVISYAPPVDIVKKLTFLILFYEDKINYQIRLLGNGKEKSLFRSGSDESVSDFIEFMNAKLVLL